MGHTRKPLGEESLHSPLCFYTFLSLCCSPQPWAAGPARGTLVEPGLLISCSSMPDPKPTEINENLDKNDFVCLTHEFKLLNLDSQPGIVSAIRHTRSFYNKKWSRADNFPLKANRNYIGTQHCLSQQHSWHTYLKLFFLYLEAVQAELCSDPTFMLLFR